jgi:hypothetical protein
MFSSYEELMAAVEERRQATLTLEVDLGGVYSQEHEDAKAELQQAKAMKTLMQGGDFLADNMDRLEARVEATRPPAHTVWVRYKKLDLAEWALLTKQAGLSPIEQYEKVLIKTFVGVWGQDPDVEEGEPVPEPLSTDPALLSSKGTKGILSGGVLYSVVQSFMAWQNAGGDVTIRPTKSGHV